MRMKRLSRSSIAGALLLGAAALMPLNAAAACPPVGASRLTGDCSPRSGYCFKWVVTGYDWMNGKKQYVAASYRRVGDSGWSYAYSFTAPCGSW